MLDPIDEIKSRLSIEDVVAPYVQLKQAGRNFKGCCPFHQEKTPSFVVSPEKQLAYCFGCHKGGDMFKFIQEIEGVDFPGALEILADKASVELAKFKSKTPSVTKDERDILTELQGEIADLYVRNLKDESKVLAYLRGRGVSDEMISEFKIGFARDDFEEAYKYLLDKGYKKSDAIKAGVLISKDTASDKVYDRFRLRLMFPISDEMGRVVAFGGRALKKDDQPKYLNSPESAVYHKGNVLYGLHLAKKHIKEQDLAIVVEGYMDVISSYQAGIRNVVASSGTALTLKQLKLLKRYTKNISFCFDSDDAGQEALLRACENAQSLDLNLKVITLDGYKDPDECAKDSADKWRDSVSGAKYYLDFYLDKQPSGLEAVKDFCDFYLRLLDGVPHPLEKKEYLAKLAKKISLPVPQLEERMESLKGQVTRGKINNADSVEKVGISAGEYLLGLVMHFRGKFDDQVKEEHADLFDDDLKNIYKQMASYYNSRACIDDGLLDGITEEERSKLQVWALYVDNRIGEWSDKDVNDEFWKALRKLQNNCSKRKQIDLTSRIREAQMNGDSKLELELMQKYAKFIS